MIFAPQLKLCSHKRFYKFLEGDYVTPINIEISLTGKCDANCKECFYRYNRDDISMDTDSLLLFLASLNGVKAITWTGGGEPTLHDRFEEIVNAVSIKQGLFTNALKTPTYNMTALEWIRVSKTNKPWPEKSIAILSHFNDKVGLCVNYTGNDQDIKDGLKLVHKYGLRYLNVRPALSLNGESTDMRLPGIKDDKLIVSGYKFNESHKKREYSKCFGYHFVPFIWHDGNFSACAYQRENPYYTLGNIYRDSFEDIIESLDRFKEVDSNCQICCKNHEINRLINNVMELEDRDFV